MDLVAYLLPFVAEHRVFLVAHGRLDEVAQEAMKLHPGVAGARQTRAAKRPGPKPVVAPVFLHQNVRCNFRSAEQAVRALVNWEIFGNPIAKG